MGNMEEVFGHFTVLLIPMAITPLSGEPQLVLDRGAH